MAKVEMSLREYDDLMEELNRYKEIFRAITTPNVSKWQLEYYEEHLDSNFTLSANIYHNLTPSTREFFENELYMNAKNLGIEGDIDLDHYNFTFGSLRHKQPETTEVEV